MMLPSAESAIPLHVEVAATHRLGHAFPTGDLFRRFVVVVTSKGQTTTKVFARRFGPKEELPGITVRAEVGDDRVTHVKPVVVDVPAVVGATWKVVYQRVQALNAPDGHDAEIAGEIVLGEGTL